MSSDQRGHVTSVTFDQQDMDDFGMVSGGTGLIHTEPEYARGTPFGATLVQGIYLLAIVEKGLFDLEPALARAGDVQVKFVSPVRSGDEFRVEITPDPVDPGSYQIEATAGGRVALVGEARMPASGNEEELA